MNGEIGKITALVTGGRVHEQTSLSVASKAEYPLSYDIRDMEVKVDEQLDLPELHPIMPAIH